MRQPKKRDRGNTPPTMANWDAADTFIQLDQPKSPQAIQIPAMVAGRFSSIRQVGQGSVGVVYAAFDEDLGRPVALKALTRSLGHQGVQSLAQKEARAVATLHHPNIVTLYDWIPGADVTWLVMEYVDGPSLAQTMQEQGPLPAAQVVNIVVQVCRALDYAHQKGVWHLDIKPANIILGVDDVPKIADFGIARSPLPGGSDTGWGTPGYAPIEQLAGEPVQQSDVYAVGALTIALISGQALPDINNANTWKTIPAVLRPALRAALSTQPNLRPNTPAALADWLERAWEARHNQHLLLLQRAWDAVMVGALAGGIMRLLSATGPLVIFTHSGTTIWIGLLLATLSAIRPEAAMFVIMLVFTAGLTWHIPTLGLLMILLWPLLAWWLRLNPRQLVLLLLTPFTNSLGFYAITPIMAGSLLSPMAAAWISVAGTFLANATHGVLSTYVVQDSLLRSPISGIGMLLRISPRDLIFTVFPVIWHSMCAPQALWSALLAAILALSFTWLRDHAEPLVLVGGASGLLICHQIAAFALLGSFSLGHLLIGLLVALPALLATPTRAVETWDYIKAWWLGYRVYRTR